MIRPRLAADLDGCVAALRAVHEADAYPLNDGQRSAAVAFYEATGWRHTHTAPADWTGPDGGPVNLRNYGR